MYLKNFPVDKKRTILDLGIYAAKSDEVLTEEEKSVVTRICEEMGLSCEYTPVHSLDSTIFTLARKFSDEEKKQIFIEIVGIVGADQITAREEAFIKKLQKDLNISDEKYGIAVSIAKDFVRVTSAIEKYME